MLKITKKEILRILHGVDAQLMQPQEIVLCGSAAIILQNIDFRATTDIDFTKIPNAAVQQAMLKFLRTANLNAIVFDLQAAGMVQLLEDYEDRLVTINDSFKFLKVKVLSVTDWVVSKLDSPKTEDIYTHGFVTLQRLAVVEKQMYKYCGLNTQKALLELQYARREIKARRKL